MATEAHLRFQAIANYTLSPNRVYLVEHDRDELCFVKTGSQFELASAPVHGTSRTQVGGEAPSGAKSSKPIITVMFGLTVLIGSIALILGAFKFGYVFLGPMPYVGVVIGLVLIVQGLMTRDAGSPVKNLAIDALIAESPVDIRNCDFLIFKDGGREGRLARPAGKPLKPYLLCHPHNFAISLADIRQVTFKREPRDAKVVLRRNAGDPVNLTIAAGEDLGSLRATLKRTFGERLMEG